MEGSDLDSKLSKLSMSSKSVRVSSNILLTPKNNFFSLYFVILLISFNYLSSSFYWTRRACADILSFSIFREIRVGIFKSFLALNSFISAVIRSTWCLGKMLQIISRNFLEFAISSVFVSYFWKDFTFKSKSNLLLENNFLLSSLPGWLEFVYLFLSPY